MAPYQAGSAYWKLYAYDVLHNCRRLDIGLFLQMASGQIDRDFAGKEPMLISVLRGSFIFMADLMRSITLPCTVDFMAVSSYGSGTKSSGQVQITKDLSDDIEGRDLIIVEDILDSGRTLYYLREIWKEKPGKHPHCHTAQQARPAGSGYCA